MKISKLFVAITLLTSTASFAGQTTIRDVADLADANARNSTGKLTGKLTVELSAYTGDSTISVVGYKQVTECVVVGEEQIPGYPETVPCLKQHEAFYPVVEVLSQKPTFTMAVDKSSVGVLMSAVSQVPDSCIKNRDAAKVIGSKPADGVVVTKVIVDAKCTAVNSVYTADADREDYGNISFQPKIMTGEILTVRLGTTVRLAMNENQDLEVGAEAIDLGNLPLTIEPSQVDLSSKAFQYDIRLFIKPYPRAK